MAEEYLDIVDENNQLTGKNELRSIVHTQGLWHRVVHVYVFRRIKGDLEFLCHLRSKFKDMNPNKWTTRFGGHPKTGETLEESSVNEVEEEIGLKLSFSDLIDGYIIKRDMYPNCEFTKVYFLDYTGKKDNFKFNDGEVQKVKWMSKTEIADALANDSEHWGPSPAKFKEAVDFLENINKKLIWTGQ